MAHSREHHYTACVTWTGDLGQGTAGYKAYSRAHRIEIPGKPDIAGSSDPAFRGDPSMHNPEDLLVAALSACHMLWYLHLAAARGIVVTGYRDDAGGTMREGENGQGRFTGVILRPVVTIAQGDKAAAAALHGEAHRNCFIANSVNFPVTHEATIHCERPG